MPRFGVNLTQAAPALAIRRAGTLMPELPDVTVYVEALRARISGQKLNSVLVRSPFLLRSADPPLTTTQGRTVHDVRRLGKRVAIASIKGSCSPEFADPRDEARVKDFDIMWLDDLLHRLELKYERHQLACEAPIHKGNRLVWTTFHPRKGQKFFCEECRREFTRQR